MPNNVDEKRKNWSRLDNAAKIFPSSSKKTDTSVFRFYCELKEIIVPEILQEAVNSAVKEFPNFLSAMRKGAFWYYLEETETKPIVAKETPVVCTQIYDGDNSALLFNVLYNQNRISFEVFHSLTDGTGALQFLKTIVYYYLKSSHHEELGKEMVFMENDASFSQKNDDSFSKYFDKEKKAKSPKNKRTYKFKARKKEEQSLQVIEAIVSVKQALAAAHSYGTTLTVYLTAVYFYTIRQEMSIQDLSRPVVIMVPVNLRQFFTSFTSKNFFALVDISYDFSSGDGSFEDIILKVSKDFAEKITKENLANRMNQFAAIERNFFAKIAPLPFKNLVLKSARTVDSNHRTAVLSNVGRVTMPEEMKEYIDFFGVLASTLEMQLCMCSFGDKLQIGFTSTFLNTDIQKNYIRFLTSNGIDVKIRSNEFNKGGDE